MGLVLVCTAFLLVPAPPTTPLVRLRLLVPAPASRPVFSVFVPAVLSPGHIIPVRSPLACVLFRSVTQRAQSRMLQSM